MKYLFIISAVFSGLFFLILITNKGKRWRHRFLAAICFLIVISCVFVFVSFDSNGRYYFPIFSELNYAIPMLYGVLLWFYAKSLTQANYVFERKDYLHFIPFLVFFFFLFGITYHSENIVLQQLGFPIPKLIVNGFYIVATILLLRNHKKELLQHVSHRDGMYHFWLKWLAYGALMLLVVAILGNVFNLFKAKDNPLLGDHFLLSFLAIYLFVLGYIGFNKTEIFQRIIEDSDLPDIEDRKVIVDITSKDNDSFLKFRTFVEQEKPYLNPQLTLSELAVLTNTSSSRLSYLINNCGGQNFYDFINSYRVEEVKSMLGEGKLKELSMLGIAMDSGFNSKASFNRIFKNTTGKTPTQYQKEVSI